MQEVVILYSVLFSVCHVVIRELISIEVYNQISDFHMELLLIVDLPAWRSDKDCLHVGQTKRVWDFIADVMYSYG